VGLWFLFLSCITRGEKEREGKGGKRIKGGWRLAHESNTIQLLTFDFTSMGGGGIKGEKKKGKKKKKEKKRKGPAEVGCLM